MKIHKKEKQEWTEVWDMEDGQLIRRAKDTGLMVTGSPFSGDLRIGGIPHADYPVQNL